MQGKIKGAIMDERIRRIAENGAGILANNAGGFVFSIKNSQGNSAIDQAFSGMLAPLNLGANAKWVKTLAYDLGAIAALELTEGKGEAVELAGRYAAEFAKGLGTSTVAADPVYMTPGLNRNSRQLTSTPPAPPARITNAIM